MSDEESFNSSDESDMTATDEMLSNSSSSEEEEEEDHDDAIQMTGVTRYFNQRTSKRTRQSGYNDDVYGKTNKNQTNKTALRFSNKSELFKHIRESYDHKSTCVPQHPKEQPTNIVNCTLKDHQILGVDWMLSLYEKSIGGVLGDDMGVGKTLQSIATIANLVQSGKVTEKAPALIIAPLSVVPGWGKEFEKFAPTLSVLSYVGDKKHRQCVRDTISTTLHNNKVPKDSIYLPKHTVLITTPELLRQDDYFVSKFDYSLAFIDEGHRYKSPKSAEIFNCSKKGNGLGHVPVRFLLTGTPLQNNTEELWSLLNVVHPKGFAYSPTKDGHIELSDADYRDSIIPYVILRRLKKDCLKLPGKKELVLHCPMSPSQQVLYKSILMKNAELVLNAAAGAKVPSGGAGLSNTVMQLRKTCGHPYLFEGVEEEPFTMEEHLVLNSGKLVLLDKLLCHLKSIGSRALIFSQFTSVLDILQDHMHLREYDYERLDGSCRAADRQTAITNFSGEGSSVFVFLLSTRAGGLGLNLTAANSVIFFDHDWNPHVDLQAQERVYRIGQTKEVVVYRLLSAGTIEDLMLSRAVKKLELSDKLTGGNNAAKDAKLSNNELLEFVLSAAASSDDEPDLDIRKSILHKESDAPEAYLNFLKADISLILASAKLVSYQKQDNDDAVSDSKQHLVYQGVDYTSHQKNGELHLEKLLKQANEKQAEEDAKNNTKNKDGEDSVKQIAVKVRTAQEKEDDRRSRLEKRWERESYTSRQLEPVPNYPNDALDSMFDSYKKQTQNAQLPPVTPDLALSDGKHHLAGDIAHPMRLWKFASEKLSFDVDANPPKTFDIIVQCVNNNGSWGSRGVFAALDNISIHIGRSYEKAKDCSDLRYGDVHLFKVKRLAAVAIVVAMKEDQINHQLLEKSLVKLRSACNRIFAEGFYPVLHLSHFGNPKIWYGIEKTFTKYLASVPTFVYYYNRRREEQKRKRHTDKKLKRRMSETATPPPPPPPPPADD